MALSSRPSSARPLDSLKEPLADVKLQPLRQIKKRAQDVLDIFSMSPVAMVKGKIDSFARQNRKLCLAVSRLKHWLGNFSLSSVWAEYRLYIKWRLLSEIWERHCSSSPRISARRSNQIRQLFVDLMDPRLI